MMTHVAEDLVSTIIPVYNRPAMLREAVQSVLAQTHRPIEIIIVDDGSTDDTPRLVEQLAHEHPDEVKFFSKANSGPGPTREVGRLEANGEFIQYLDSDDLLHPHKFAVQVRLLREHPDCGIAYGRSRLVDFSGCVIADPLKATGRKYDTLFPHLLAERWWSTHTPLYRRTVCDAVGPWSDLRFSQDWEYEARAGAAQVRLAWCDVTVSDTRQHAATRQTGHGRWLSPQDRVRFFSTLLDCALEAGVRLDSPQMEHFSRWVFHHARMCGAMGDGDASRSLFKLALQTAKGPAQKLRLYRLGASILGWKLVGHLVCKLDGSSSRGLMSQ